MAEINIKGIGRVRVSDNFFELPLEEQNRTVDQIVTEMRQREDISVAEDVARSSVKGTATGVGSLIDFPATVGQLMKTGVEKGYQAITGKPIPEAFSQGMGSVELPLIGNLMEPKAMPALESAAPEMMGYEPKTTAGEYAETVTEFLPSALGGGLKGLVQYGIAPAVVSETAGQLTKGTELEPYARLAGAILTPAGESALRRIISPAGGKVDDATAEAVKLLAKEKVIPSAGQKTGSKAVQYLEEATSQGRDLVTNAYENFTAAVLRRFNIDAKRATDDVLKTIDQNLKSQFSNTIQKSKPMPKVDDFKNAIRINAQYRQSVEQVVPVFSTIQKRIRQSLKNGTPLQPRQLQEWWSSVGEMTTEGGAKGAAAREMRNLLESLISKGLSPDDVKGWAKARSQYREFLSVKNSLSGAADDAIKGIIAPTALRTSIKQVFGNDYVMGRSDLGKLADAGHLIMKRLPTSGTAERTAAKQAGIALGGSGATGFTAMASGITDPQAIGFAGLAGLALPYGVQRAAASPAGQAYLSNQLLGQGPEYLRNQGLLRLLAGTSASQQ